jgi:hypothetical protein
MPQVNSNKNGMVPPLLSLNQVNNGSLIMNPNQISFQKSTSKFQVK